MRPPFSILLFVGLVAATATACREDGMQGYLDGTRLVASMEIVELQGGVVGFTGTYYRIETDGTWTSGPITPGKGEKGTPAAKGKLSNEQLTELSEQLHRHQLSTLTNHGRPDVNPRVVKITMGTETRVLNPKPGEASEEEDQQVRKRYSGILSAVKALCTSSAPSP